MLTTSWDDGHPADLRIRDLLAKYGLKATFYIPRNNVEGRPVMAERDIRELALGMEVGGHTLDHIDLTKLSSENVSRQIGQGKAWLEDVIGGTVHGFCYPRGHYRAEIAREVRAAGFAYARTTANFHIAPALDCFALPTTIQFFPHGRGVYARNFLRFGHFQARTKPFVLAMLAPNLQQRAETLANHAIARSVYFHLWGHSWEIEALNLWKELEHVFCHLRSLGVSAVTNETVSSCLASAIGSHRTP